MIKDYWNKESWASLSEWRRIENAKISGIPTNKRLYIPQRNISPTWESNLAQQGIYPNVIFSEKIREWGQSPTKRYEMTSLRGKVTFGDSKQELSQEEREMLKWRPGYGTILEQSRRVERLSVSRAYFFALDDFPDLVLCPVVELGKTLPTWGVTKLGLTEIVLNPFYSGECDSTLPEWKIIQALAGTSSFSAGPQFEVNTADNLIDRFNKMTMDVERAISE